jgi:stage III sporulation protein AD
MDITLKIAAIALCASVLAVLIRKTEPAIAMCVAIGGAAAILYLAVTPFRQVLETVCDIAEEGGVSQPAIKMVMKTMCISIVTKISSDVCREAGLTSSSTAIELAGTVSALYVTLPVMKTLLSMIKGLL